MLALATNDAPPTWGSDFLPIWDALKQTHAALYPHEAGQLSELLRSDSRTLPKRLNEHLTFAELLLRRSINTEALFVFVFDKARWRMVDPRSLAAGLEFSINKRAHDWRDVASPFYRECRPLSAGSMGKLRGADIPFDYATVLRGPCSGVRVHRDQLSDLLSEIQQAAVDELPAWLLEDSKSRCAIEGAVERKFQLREHASRGGRPKGRVDELSERVIGLLVTAKNPNLPTGEVLARLGRGGAVQHDQRYVSYARRDGTKKRIRRKAFGEKLRFCRAEATARLARP